METTTKKQALLEAIYQKLQTAYEDTLEDVLELLKICEKEDKEDLQAFEDTKNEPTIPWEEVKRDLDL